MTIGWKMKLMKDVSCSTANSKLIWAVLKPHIYIKVGLYIPIPLYILVNVASQSYHFRQLRSILFFIPPAFLSFASFRHIFLSHSCIFRVYFVLYLLCSGHSCYYPLQFVLLSSDISMTFLSQSSVFVFHSSCVRAKYIRGFLLRMRDEFYFVSIRIPFVCNFGIVWVGHKALYNRCFPHDIASNAPFIVCPKTISILCMIP